MATQAEHSAQITSTRDAVILIPGFSLGPQDDCVDICARRLALAFDRSAKSPKASFVTSGGTEEDYGGGQTRRVTISRKDGVSQTPFMDIYAFDYGPPLTGEFSKRNPFMQALSVGFLLLANVGRLFKAMSARCKGASHKVHVFYAGALFLAVSVYAVLLTFTVGATVYDAFRLQAPPAAQSSSAENPGSQAKNGKPAGKGGSSGAGRQSSDDKKESAPAVSVPADMLFVPKWLWWMKTFFVITAALGLASATDMKKILAYVSAESTCAVNYINYDARGLALRGQLARLLEHIMERDDVVYERVHVFSYSFGSILALDTLFPKAEEHSKRFGCVDSLVTIGCPFDFIKAFWHDYFDSRSVCGLTVPKWLNVYNPADVLGSDFSSRVNKHKDEKIGIMLETRLSDGSGCIGPKNIRFGADKPLGRYGFIGLIGLMGFRLHSQYWDQTDHVAMSCFDSIVTELYNGKPALD